MFVSSSLVALLSSLLALSSILEDVLYVGDFRVDPERLVFIPPPLGVVAMSSE